MNEMEKIVSLTPAYEEEVGSTRRTPGIHPMHISFVLKGPKGAAVLDVNTGWYLRRTQKRLASKWYGREVSEKLPHYAHLSVHTYINPVEGWDQTETNCEFINGAKCFCKSWAVGEQEIEDFLLNGERWLWNRLELLYDEELRSLEEPQMYEGA